MIARLGWALILLCALTRTAFADDPAKRWLTLETEHFHIVYYVYPDGHGEAEVAQHLAKVTEESHRRLVALLGPGLSVKRKTWVVVTDDTDDFNGSATVLPYPNIRLFATAPDDRAELNDYDDWLRALFTHEYTHVLHLGTMGGACQTVVNALLGWGLGLVYAPNQSQPRFIIEGLAVFEESHRTSGGRLHNSIWDMYLRAQTLEGRFQTLPQFTNNPIQFPFGNSAYLYGSELMNYVADHYGEAALRREFQDYGTNCIPLAINRSVKRALGKTWVELYADFRAEMSRHYGAQRDAIVAKGLTAARTLTGFRPEATRPRFSADGKQVIFVDSDGNSRTQLRRIELDSGRLSTELYFDALGGLSYDKRGETGVFHAVAPWHTFYFYNDLYEYDRSSKRSKRLTEGLRATNPALSPDGTKVAFEINRASSRGLALLDRASGKIDTLIAASGFEQVYTPTFSPDGNTLAFSWWRTGGYRDIWTLDLRTRELLQITSDRSVDMEPRYSPDGKYLYFVSDRSGVHNLYAYDLAARTLYQASNVINGVFDPDISPDGKQVVFVGFVADGYNIQLAPLDPAHFLPAVAAPTRPLAEPVPTAPPLPAHRYWPFATLIPWTFRPSAVPDGYGELLGLSIRGSDIAGHHAWSVDLAFGTGRADDVNFDANYSYSGLWPAFNFGVSRSLSRRGGLIINGSERGYDQEDWSFGAGVSLPILRQIVTSSTINLSYSFNSARNLSPKPLLDPSDLSPIFPNVGRSAGFGISWRFNNTRRYVYSISAELGRDIGISLGLSSRYLGGDRESYSMSWHWQEFAPLPFRSRWLRNQVLSFNYSGGIASLGNFSLGGYPQQDLLKSIYDFSRPGSASLRGYDFASVRGTQFHVLNFEYRFPIVWIEKGFQTFPLYLQRLHGRVFADYGGAFSSGFDLSKLKLGTGAELILEVTYGWYFPASLQLGYAYGVMSGGSNQVYFLLNSPF